MRWSTASAKSPSRRTLASRQGCCEHALPSNTFPQPRAAQGAQLDMPLPVGCCMSAGVARFFTARRSPARPAPWLQCHKPRPLRTRPARPAEPSERSQCADAADKSSPQARARAPSQPSLPDDAELLMSGNNAALSAVDERAGGAGAALRGAPRSLRAHTTARRRRDPTNALQRGSRSSQSCNNPISLNGELDPAAIPHIHASPPVPIRHTQRTPPLAGLPASVPTHGTACAAAQLERQHGSTAARQHGSTAARQLHKPWRHWNRRQLGQ